MVGSYEPDEIPELDESGSTATLKHIPKDGTLQLFFHGILQYRGRDYQLDGNRAKSRFSYRTGMDKEPEQSLRAFYWRDWYE